DSSRSRNPVAGIWAIQGLVSNIPGMSISPKRMIARALAWPLPWPRARAAPGITALFLDALGEAGHHAIRIHQLQRVPAPAIPGDPLQRIGVGPLHFHSLRARHHRHGHGTEVER